MKRHEIAINQFMEGYRCSQAVLDAYVDDFNFDSNLAKKISLALAGGSGIGGECGAVSGAYLVIGLKYGFTHPDDPERFMMIIDKNRSFVEKFKALHKNINCPDLLGIDVLDEEGHKQFVDNNMKEKVCTQFVGSAIKILDEIFSGQ